jgi:hypothetical protein
MEFFPPFREMESLLGFSWTRFLQKRVYQEVAAEHHRSWTEDGVTTNS